MLRFAVFLVLLAAAWVVNQPGQAAAGGAAKWYKGNLHTHTIHSDGDSTPNEVVDWYKSHRYHFLALTDHNYFTEIDNLNLVHAAKERFLLITGEEVTSSFEKRPVHVNAIGHTRLVDPLFGATMVETLQKNIDAIKAAGGLPSVNHPNFVWAFTAKELMQVQGEYFFEVYNGHPQVHNLGGGGVQSMDELWDTLLSAGKRWHGIAVDDAHVYKRLGKDLSNPGRGWVMVRAEKLEGPLILDSLRRGDFYSSTGVEFAALDTTDNTLSVEVKQALSNKYRIHFIGQDGKILKTSYEPKAEYKLASGDRYVRARVDASTGDQAWTQPLWAR